RLLAHGGPEALGGAVELALLDLGALELHEDALVLDGAGAEARGLLEEALLVAAEGRRIAPIGDQDPAKGAVLEDRNAADGAHRAGLLVVGQDVARLEVRDADGRALREHRAEDPVARREGALGERGLLARELADPQALATLVEPQEHRGVDVQAFAHEAQREEHRQLDLLDPRAQEALLIERARRRRRLLDGLDGRAEEAIAAGLLADAVALG